MNEHNKQTWFSVSDKPIKNKGYFHTHDSFQDEKCHQNVHIGKRKYSANRNCKYSNLNKKNVLLYDLESTEQRNEQICIVDEKTTVKKTKTATERQYCITFRYAIFSFAVYE